MMFGRDLDEIYYPPVRTLIFQEIFWLDMPIP